MRSPTLMAFAGNISYHYAHRHARPSGIRESLRRRGRFEVCEKLRQIRDRLQVGRAGSDGQELGRGVQKYSKDEKQDLMHIATCRLLSIYGYYELKGTDDEGWPHWEMKLKLPKMSLGEQDYLLKQAAIEYFRETQLN